MLNLETGKKNKVLRKVSEEIKSSELKKYVKLGKEMLKYIKDPENGGVGLAAPQVGHSKRLIVVGLPKTLEDESFSVMMMINPKIIEHSEETEIGVEGCLSVPGETGDVERFFSVKISFLNHKGEENRLILKSFQAKIVQHEIDHLDGVLFTDKIVK